MTTEGVVGGAVMRTIRSTVSFPRRRESRGSGRWCVGLLDPRLRGDDMVGGVTFCGWGGSGNGDFRFRGNDAVGGVAPVSSQRKLGPRVSKAPSVVGESWAPAFAGVTFCGWDG